MSILPLLNHLGPGLFEELDGFGFQGSQDHSRPRRIWFSWSDDVWFPLVETEPGVQRRRPKLLRCNDVPNFCGTVIHPKMDPLQLDMWASNGKKKYGQLAKDRIPQVVKTVIYTDLPLWLAGMTILHKLLHELQTPSGGLRHKRVCSPLENSVAWMQTPCWILNLFSLTNDFNLSLHAMNRRKWAWMCLV